MSVQRFITGKRFIWDKKHFQVNDVLYDNRVIIEDTNDGEFMTIPMLELVNALFSGNLHFEVKNPKKLSHDLITNFPYTDISDCPPRLQAVARFRFWVTEPLVLLGNKRTKADVRARVKEVLLAVKNKTVPVKLTYGFQDIFTIRTDLSKSSVDRWIRDLIDANYDIRGLVPRSEDQGGVGNSRLHPDVEEIVLTTIEELYKRRERTTIKTLRNEIHLRIEEANLERDKDDQLKKPGISTVDRRLKQLGVRERFLIRHGHYKTDKEFTQYGDSYTSEKPLDVIEIDHTTIDYIVVDPEDGLPIGRPTITFAIDRCTRYPFGYYLGFEPASYLTVMQCLSHGIRPKGNVKEVYGTAHDWTAYGIPRVLVTDQGPEFIGKSLEDACLQLGTVLRPNPGRNPHLKAMIERFFSTNNAGFVHTIEGTTFSNIINKGDYNSMKMALLSLPQLDKTSHIFWLDHYAEDYHRGLKGIPARRWEAHINHGFYPRLPPNINDLDILLGQKARRSLFHYGIELFNLRYQRSSASISLLRKRMGNLSQEELKNREWPDRKVTVKINPLDLSNVHIYDPFEKKYIELFALAQEYTKGLSLWKHRVINNYTLKEKGTVDIEGLAQAKRKIQAEVEKAKKRKKLQTRKKTARWETGGKPASQLSDEVPASQNDASQEIAQPKTNSHSEIGQDGIKLTYTSEELESAGWSIFSENQSEEEE